MSESDFDVNRTSSAFIWQMDEPVDEHADKEVIEACSRRYLARDFVCSERKPRELQLQIAFRFFFSANLEPLFNESARVLLLFRDILILI
jgi:hypothetical protein